MGSGGTRNPAWWAERLVVVACLAATGWLWFGMGAFFTPLPVFHAERPVTISVEWDHDLVLSAVGKDTTTCLIRPAAGPERSVVVDPGSDDGPGAIETAWWSGAAEVTCAATVSGKVGIPDVLPWVMIRIMGGLVPASIAFILIERWAR